MSDLFEKGYQCEKSGDFAGALALYLEAAEQGDDEAECRIGNIYRFGRGFPKDYEKALYWYHRSAQKGNSYAESNIGSMYRFGQGVEKNYDIAFEWYLRSAEKDNDFAFQNMGSMYRFGEGREINYAEALRCYTKAAEKGNMFSQSNIGSMYRFGEGVVRDYYQAYHWYSLAAASGYAYAKYELGVLFYHGYGIEHDGDKAFKLLNEYERDTWLDFKKNGEAYYYLGECYKNGTGTKRDYRAAKECYLKAIELGYNCQYALSVVQAELEEAPEQNLMRGYAEQLLKEKIPQKKIYDRIAKDLAAEFGALWQVMTTQSQRFLITGMLTYVSFYAMGSQVYVYLDFSSAITQMFKALEKELGTHLYTNYVKYLKENDVRAADFTRKRTFIKKVGAGKYEYKNENDLSEFTLGALNLTLGYDRAAGEEGCTTAKAEGAKGQIDKTMFEYLNALFKKDAFARSNRECEITDYIISIYQEVKTIADSLRNPAAHSEIMKCKRAEACGNYIIKVKKLLIRFLEKINI